MVVDATKEHVERLASSMRAEDRAEVSALQGYTPLEAIQESVQVSDYAKALLVDGEVLAIWGVSPCGTTLLTQTDGCAWALTGEAVERHKKLFLRTSREVLRGMLQRHRRLFNLVDARYEKALRWAKWLGFKVGPPQPIGRDGGLFCLIEIWSSEWAQ